MKPAIHISALAISVAAISCSAPSGMTVREYSALTNPSRPAAFPEKLTLTIHEPGRPSKTLSPAAIRPGKPFTISDQRDFIFPSAYDFATPAANGAAITPATPTGFRTEHTGFSAELSASRKGPLVLIEGTVTVKEFTGFSKMGGELGQPILGDRGRVLTENRIEMPKIATYTTPVHVALRPDASTKFEIAHRTNDTTVTVNFGPNQ